MMTTTGVGLDLARDLDPLHQVFAQTTIKGREQIHLEIPAVEIAVLVHLELVLASALVETQGVSGQELQQEDSWVTCLVTESKYLIYSRRNYQIGDNTRFCTFCF